MRGLFIGDCGYTWSCGSNNSNNPIVQDLGNWDVSNVLDMSLMFSSNNNPSGKTNISLWNVRNVENMDSMFAGALYGPAESLSNWYCVENTSYTNFTTFGTNGKAEDNWADMYPLFWLVSGIAPSAPELTTPLNNSINLETSIKFSWKADTSIAKEFEVSIVENSNTIFLDTVIVDTFLVVNKLNPDDTYFWKVQGINFNGSWVGPWSEIWSFTTASNFRLHENGVGGICNDAEVGETGVVNDILYQSERLTKLPFKI